MSLQIKKAHVDVEKEVRERLKVLSERFGFSFSDIISMALTFLEKKELSIFIKGDIARVKVNVKKAHLNSAFAKSLMDKGYDIFLPEINARQAHYIKRRLQKDLNVAITVHPVNIGRTKKENGYLLMWIPIKHQTRRT